MYEGSLQPVSNRADYIETFTVTNSEDGTFPAITDAEFRMTANCGSVAKSLGSGMEYDDTTGALVLTVPESEMRSLRPGTYESGLRVKIDGYWVQLIAGASLAVVDGVVS